MHEDWSKRAPATGNTPAATSPVPTWSLRAGSAWIRSELFYPGIRFNRNAGSARVRFSFDEGRLLDPVAAQQPNARMQFSGVSKRADRFSIAGPAAWPANRFERCSQCFRRCYCVLREKA